MTALALLFGLFALVDGLTLLVSALRQKVGPGRCPAYAVEGASGITAGLISFGWPGITVPAMGVLVGAWAVTTGIAELWATGQSRHARRHEAVLLPASLLTGSASVTTGVLLLARSDATPIPLSRVTGACALIVGAMAAFTAWRLYGTTVSRTASRRPRPA
ncbi:DUF308 domain-containing protein [Streptomyces phaeoluteigriseus]|uniref:DUF308 domain-containing protein n=1 Tax=Streptomyces phaeoluteigriseus TaxID=114686 RepID=A0ABY4ZAD8_9ACTN|nr:DUF308 domain-containing protein [Streptomyces phaeoluteigriseus]